MVFSCFLHFSLFSQPPRLKAFKTRPFVDGAKTLIGGQVLLGGCVSECFGLLIRRSFMFGIAGYDIIRDVVIRD